MARWHSRVVQIRSGFSWFASFVLLSLMLLLHLRKNQQLLSRHSSPGDVINLRKSTKRKFKCSKSRFLGDKYGGWAFCAPLGSLSNAVVYTVGVGRNIEWDKAMIREFSTKHYGWDPTPTGMDFMRKTKPPPGFTFHPFGLGVKDGTVTVKLPKGNTDSYTIMEYGQRAQNGTVNSINVLTIASMLKKLGHDHLFILKIDIEGAEFSVINEWVRTNYSVPADQILVEFHDRYFRYLPARHRASLVPNAVHQMRQLGYEVFHREKWEISFIRVD